MRGKQDLLSVDMSRSELLAQHCLAFSQKDMDQQTLFVQFNQDLFDSIFTTQIPIEEAVVFEFCKGVSKEFMHLQERLIEQHEGLLKIYKNILAGDTMQLGYFSMALSNHIHLEKQQLFGLINDYLPEEKIQVINQIYAAHEDVG